MATSTTPNTTLSRIRDFLDDFLYKQILRRIFLLSKLGQQSILGEASTGYNFDHMYENKPEGKFLVGRLIDRIVLNFPSVQATRNRKKNIIKILSDEIENLRILNRPVRIIDAACGASRYMIELNDMYRDFACEVIGVDYDRKSLKLGSFLAQKYRIDESRLRLVKGNVFHLQHLKNFGARINWRPNIVVASGLIDYLDDNKVRLVFTEVYQGIENGGLFLFSSQESNPSRKLMEKICRTNEGPWIIHYRKPAILRQWLLEAGFRDVAIGKDKWNMYNLCTARKLV